MKPPANMSISLLLQLFCYSKSVKDTVIYKEDSYLCKNNKEEYDARGGESNGERVPDTAIIR